jgi:alpha-beta hydrolase superfamily lysophospholipase
VDEAGRTVAKGEVKPEADTDTTWYVASDADPPSAFVAELASSWYRSPAKTADAPSHCRADSEWPKSATDSSTDHTLRLTVTAVATKLPYLRMHSYKKSCASEAASANATRCSAAAGCR